MCALGCRGGRPGELVDACRDGNCALGARGGGGHDGDVLLEWRPSAAAGTHQRGFGGARGAHPPAGVGEHAAGDERKEEAPLDTDGIAVAGGAGEHAVEDQERGPAAGEHHDRAVTAWHVEVAALSACEQQRDNAGGDEEDSGLDERDVAEGGDGVRVDDVALAVQRL